MSDEAKGPPEQGGESPQSRGGIDPFLQLLAEMRPRLERLFVRYRVPTEKAEEILEETLLVMLYRYDELSRPERWLMRTLRLRCSRYWQQHQKKIIAAIDQEIRAWLADETATLEELTWRHVVLHRQIDRMPWRCRRYLRSHFAAGAAADDLAAADFWSLGTANLKRDPRARCLSALVHRLALASVDA